MTSKTFKSALDSPVTLEVERETRPAGVYLTIGVATILLAPSDAPALSLAILEAAGWPEEAKTSVTHTIMADLRAVIATQERATAEAKDRAELEAEALELFNISQGTNLGAWAPRTDRSVINIWVEIAKRAREIAGRAEK